MSNLYEIYLACAAGIVISVVLPILRTYLPGGRAGTLAAVRAR